MTTIERFLTDLWALLSWMITSVLNAFSWPEWLLIIAFALTVVLVIEAAPTIKRKARHRREGRHRDDS